MERTAERPFTTSWKVNVPQPNGRSGATIPHSQGSTQPGASTPLNVPFAFRPLSNTRRAEPLNTPVLALKLNE